MDTGIRKILQIELAVRPDSDQRGMTASGMIVINPPWQLETQMKKILPYLTGCLCRKEQVLGRWSGLRLSKLNTDSTSVDACAIINSDLQYFLEK